jgi:hypothetical protein
VSDSRTVNMATGIQFDQPMFSWDANDTYMEFQRFKQHVEFTFKGPLAGTDDKHRAGWLGMWIGQQGREVYKTFTWTGDQEDDPKEILNKLEEYVRPRKNKRMARFKVQRRTQSDSESFDNFVKDLRILLMDCEYTDNDDILTDLIINGAKHHKVQEKLLDQGQKLTLAKAIEIGQRFELSQSQMKAMHGEEVLTVKTNRQFAAKKKPTQTQSGKTTYNDTRKRGEASGVKYNHASDCTSCGLEHDQGKCPAMGSYCNYCKKPNHWLKMCRKRKQRRQISSLQNDSVQDSSDDEEALYIGTISQDDDETPVYNVSNDKWIVDLRVHNQDISFRIDTGAKCCIMVKSQLDTLTANGQDTKLSASQRTLRSFSNHKIKPVGTVSLPVSYKDKQTSVQFEIVDLKQENIISGDIAEKIGLIQRKHNIKEMSAQEELQRDFPELIKTTGTLPGEYSITIDENAKGVIHPARRLAAAIKPRAIEKLREMESNKYITSVSEPTEWVSSMVVSLRKDKIRICIDPKDLNKVIKREHRPMKTIDDVIASIPDATVFSVIDAKSGFLQIRLDQKSSFLTTFNTPIGRYRWLRLPFGIKSAP